MVMRELAGKRMQNWLPNASVLFILQALDNLMERNEPIDALERAALIAHCELFSLHSN